LDLATLKGGAESLVVGVTSTGHGSGCSSFALELALAYQSAGRAVLLIEADASGERLSSRHGMPPGSGLLNVARGDARLEGCVHSMTMDNSKLDVLTTGAENHALTQLVRAELTLDEFRHVVTTAAERYPVLVIDLGQLKAGRQSAIGAALSDQVVVVTSAGERQKTLNAACELLDRLVAQRYRLMFNRASTLDPQLADVQGPVADTLDDSPWSRWLRRNKEGSRHVA
jgi:Mrp family chromosome partitioning ATPase